MLLVWSYPHTTGGVDQQYLNPYKTIRVYTKCKSSLAFHLVHFVAYKSLKVLC